MQTSNIERKIIRKYLKKYLSEDLGSGDITSNLIDNREVTANIIAKSSGYVSGITEAIMLCDMVKLTAEPLLQDGDYVETGQNILKIKGGLQDILGIERTALNILMRMSAITSSTKILVKKVQEINNEVRIAASRKTTPGFRLFEKRAVIAGGGDPHRWRLDDMVLLKDTHLDAVGHDIKQLIENTKKKTSFSKKIEIEVENIHDAIIAASIGVDIIMIDNQKPEQVEEFIHKIRSSAIENQQNIPLIEVSGNISDDNLLKYVKSGVNIISTSQITMRPYVWVDMSLKIDI